MRKIIGLLIGLTLLTGCQKVTHASSETDDLKQTLAAVALTPQMRSSDLDTGTLLRNQQVLTAYRCPTKRVITDAPQSARTYQFQIGNGTHRYHIVYVNGDQVIYGDLSKATTLKQFAQSGKEATVAQLLKQTKAAQVARMQKLLVLDGKTAMAKVVKSDPQTAATFSGPADLAHMTRTKATEWAWNHYHTTTLNNSGAAVLSQYRVQAVKAADDSWTIAFRKPVAGSNMERLVAQYQITTAGKLIALVENAS